MLEPSLVHLAVSDADAGLGNQLRQTACGMLDRVDPVMHEEDLSVAQQLSTYCGGDHLLFELTNVGHHGMTVLGGRVHDRHVADAGHRHLERPGDRRCRKRQHVHARAQRLQLLLLLDAEALLLVDDDQPEVREGDVGLKQPVRPHDDIDLADRQIGNDLLCFGCREKAGQHLDPHGEVAKTFDQGGVVLLSQDRRGHQQRHLLARGNRLECGSYRDLRLAITDVPAHEAVHGNGLLHVVLDLVYRAQLVGRLFVGKGVLELALPRRVRPEREAL